jgi:hypothetical protein
MFGDPAISGHWPFISLTLCSAAVAPRCRKAAGRRPVVAQKPLIHRSARKFQRARVTAVSFLTQCAC